jgi:hypothetical protein
MNERIKQLALECYSPYTNFDYKKFAELIVQECMKVAVFKDSGMIATADVAGYMAAGRSTAARMIKEHFGVEE